MPDQPTLFANDPVPGVARLLRHAGIGGIAALSQASSGIVISALHIRMLGSEGFAGIAALLAAGAMIVFAASQAPSALASRESARAGSAGFPDHARGLLASLVGLSLALAAGAALTSIAIAPLAWEGTTRAMAAAIATSSAAGVIMGVSCGLLGGVSRPLVAQAAAALHSLGTLALLSIAIWIGKPYSAELALAAHAVSGSAVALWAALQAILGARRAGITWALPERGDFRARASFMAPLFVSSGLVSATAKLPLILSARALTPEAVALLAVSLQFSALAGSLMTTLGRSVTRSLHRLHEIDRKDFVVATLRRSEAISTALAAINIAGFLVLGPLALSTAYGIEGVEPTAVGASLVALASLNAVLGLRAGMIAMTGRTALATSLRAVELIVMLALLLALLSSLGVWAPIVALSISSILHATLSRIALRRLEGI